MQTKNCRAFAALAMLAISTLNSQFSTCHAQGTAFTYQGRLNVNGSPANGLYDFRFRLDADPVGNTILDTVFTNSIGVANGLFVTTIDFGPGWFNGSNYWLEVDVRTNAAASYTTLTPFQSLTPTPYATFAGTASNVSGTVSAAQLTGAVPSANLAGTYGSAVTLSNPGNSLAGNFTGNGASVSNVNAAALNGIPATGFWQLGGNSVAGGQFLGSTNNQSLAILVAGQRALLITTNPADSANFIGGSPANVVDAGVEGAVIAGGGTANYFGVPSSNHISANFGVIGGGTGNAIQSLAVESFIGGGYENIIQTNSNNSIIGSGYQNTIQQNDYEATIAGGWTNTIQSNNEQSTIGGGEGNVIQYGAYLSTISGGVDNLVQTNAQGAVIGGGYLNANGGYLSAILGGQQNTIQPQANYSAIVGGSGNTLIGSAGGNAFDFIGGGSGNSIQINTPYSIIGGGTANTIWTGSYGSVIGGGQQDSIGTNSDHSAIGGGWANTIGQNDYEGVIAGGYVDSMGGFSGYSAIGGGQFNVIGTNSPSSVIPGGANNVIGNSAPYALAAGQQAQALNQGAFVWADSQNIPFASTANDQFLIRAQGGVGINMNNPGGASLYVRGDRTNSWPNSMSWFENTDTGTNSSPALRVEVDGSAPAGALSVSVEGGGLIAQFGNGVAFVSQLDVNGNWTANSFNGNGGGLTGLNASQLTSIGNTNGTAAYNFFVGPSGNSTTSGGGNTSIGEYALYDNTTGYGNEASGYLALSNNASGYDNTANGFAALFGNVGGYYNTADGAGALLNNTNGFDNTATGERALLKNTSGIANTASGFTALQNNVTGSYNTANGAGALGSNNGSNNIALGYNAGFSLNTNESGNIDIGNLGVAGDNNIIRIGDPAVQVLTYLAGAIIGNGAGLTNINAANVAADGAQNVLVGSRNSTGGDGVENTAVGYEALFSNTTGDFNTAVGYEALFSNTGSGDFSTANFNTASGFNSLYSNTSGNGNTADGVVALYGNVSGSYNTAIGNSALNQLGAFVGAGGTNNIALGYLAGSAFTGNESSNIDIGNLGKAAESNVIRIGTPGIQTQAYLAGVINGNGGGLTNLNAARLSGSVPAGVSVPSANLTGALPALSGASLTSLNASQLTSGVVPQSLLPGFQSSSNYIAVGGGQNNNIVASADHAGIGGGFNNTIGANDYQATIAGGYYNTISASSGYAAIGGGQYNTNSSNEGVIAGGQINLASGQYQSTVGGGYQDTASGSYATVPGGFQNVASGVAAFAAGARAQATNDGTFVWSDNSVTTPFASTNSNSFNVRAAGGYRLYTTSSGIGGAGVYLAANGSSWTSVSDRNAKKNFQPVNPEAVLEKLAAIPIQQWNYKWENDGDVPNIGPMAQDFKAAFYPGRDDTGITTLEFDGVELAAIQGLNQKMNEKDAEIQRLKAKADEVDSLKKQLADLEQVVQTLAARK